MTKVGSRFPVFILISLLTACASGAPPAPTSRTPDAATWQNTPAAAASVTSSPMREEPSLTAPSETLQPSLTSTLSPLAWMTMPIVPAGISRRVVEIYQRGRELGNDPNAFSKIGDCDATPTWFLGDFDLGPEYYSLGEYGYLQPVIDAFQGSYGRTSVAVGRGFTAASVLTSLWADPSLCLAGESPLVCEIRLQHPSFALILLGTNDINNPDAFEANLRQVLDLLIFYGIVPILATKADNLEGDHTINTAIARLAYEYELPLWNYWLAVQPLPHHGLQADGAHLTFASNHFDDPMRMQAAWPWRNLTALQVLDLVWRGVTTGP